MDKTSLIIPCYWADESFVEMTQRCLNSLRYGRPDEVIVIDDGSPVKPWRTDEPAISGWGKRQGVSVWGSMTNRGYAAAVNMGLSRATGDILIISNNDITFTPGWLEAILKPLNEGYDISSICTSDNGYMTRDEITEGDKFGSLWAMKREVYEKLGGLDERFNKGLFEDLDYWRRAQDAGFRIGKNHAHIVEHEGKSTFKIVDPENRLFTENSLVYKEKWGDKAHIISLGENKIIVLDDYDLNKYDERRRQQILAKELSIDDLV